jgi:serine/threonine protein kinase
MNRLNILHRNIHPDCVTVYDPRDPQYSTATIAEANVNMLPSVKPALPVFQDLSKQRAFGSILPSSSHDNAGTSSSNSNNNNSSSDSNALEGERNALVKSKRSTRKLNETSNFAEQYRSSDPIHATKPVCEIGDYWFLSNSRKAGCEYSQGRADWGYIHTMPPEVVHGGGAASIAISDRSDIWGLGICIYYWATAGQYPDVGIESKSAPVDLGRIIKKLPLKWGPWLHGVIQMCLQKHPSHRTSAEELYSYLAIARAGHSNTT